MKNQFIPYEQALKLKALGFDVMCIMWYNKTELVLNYNKNTESWQSEYTCSAPLWQQAFDWFRKEWAIHSWIRPNLVIDIPITYQFSIDDNIDEEWHHTYEEAELACLDKLIEIVEQQKK